MLTRAADEASVTDLRRQCAGSHDAAAPGERCRRARKAATGEHRGACTGRRRNWSRRTTCRRHHARRRHASGNDRCVLVNIDRDVRRLRPAALGIGMARTKSGCWVISAPGANEAVIECFPGNPWPDELKEIKPDGDGQRILATAVREEVVTAGSTVPAMVLHHPDIVATKRFTFKAPF